MESKVQYGGKIVAEENLIFYVDAYNGINNGLSNFNNYSPTTTQSIWYDLSNNRGDIQMTKFSYSASNNGHFILTGSGGGGAGVGQSDAFLPIVTSSVLTVEMFYNSTVQITNITALFAFGSGISSATSSLWVGLGNATGGSRVYIGALDSGFSSSIAFSANTWSCATIVVGPSGTTPTLYVNGGSSSGSFNGNAFPQSSTGNYIYFARKAGGAGLRNLDALVRIGSIKIWNKGLSTDEIAQSYNTTKGRYGL